jgi:ribonuclease P protein component
VRLHREFDHVYQQGRRVAGRYVLLHAVPNDLGRPRLGTTVGRRVGGAVVRNRVKRWIRETFRLNKAAFPPEHDVVIQARAGAADATHEALEREILALAARYLERWPA